MTWRYFRQFELREALAHAEAGGIAVHDSGRLRGSQPTAHLLAGTHGELMTAAEELGLEFKHLQLAPRPHFDLWAMPLLEALRRCERDSAGKPPRRCRVCGCSQRFGCPGGCYWVAEDLCSACVEKGIGGL